MNSLLSMMGMRGNQSSPLGQMMRGGMSGPKPSAFGQQPTGMAGPGGMNPLIQNTSIGGIRPLMPVQGPQQPTQAAPAPAPAPQQAAAPQQPLPGWYAPNTSIRNFMPGTTLPGAMTDPRIMYGMSDVAGNGAGLIPGLGQR